MSQSGNIYVTAGSVVQCSHDTGGEIQGLEGWRVIIVTLLTIPAHHYTELTDSVTMGTTPLATGTIRKLNPTRNDYYLT